MGTRRIVVISIHEMTERFQTDLEDELNGSVSGEIVRELVEAILNYYCYGILEQSGVVENTLIRMGVKKGMVDEVSNRLSSTLHRTIQQGFQIVYPCRFYSFRWCGDTDLAVEESLIRRVSNAPSLGEEDV